MKNVLYYGLAVAGSQALHVALRLYPLTRDAFSPPGALFQVRGIATPAVALAITAILIAVWGKRLVLSAGITAAAAGCVVTGGALMPLVWAFAEWARVLAGGTMPAEWLTPLTAFSGLAGVMLMGVLFAVLATPAVGPVVIGTLLLMRKALGVRVPQRPSADAA